MPRTSNTEKHYINKDDLWNEIRNYYELDDADLAAGGEGIVMPDSLGSMILQISENIMKAQNLSGYPFKDQMEGDAYLRMVLILTKRKFNLHSHLQHPVNKKAKYSGWKLSKEGRLAKKEHPNAIFIPMTNSKDEDGNEQESFDLSGTVMVMEPIEDVVTEGGLPCYQKVTNMTGLFEPTKRGTVEVSHQHREPAFTVTEDGDKEPIMVKNNAFGYLSLIATREAITRIKKETKNYNAIHDFQEQEFTRFLSENPEMTPQKIDDDTYDIILD